MGEDQSRDQEQWRDQRRDAAAEQAARLERRKAAETEAARRLVEDFAADASRHGIRTVPLRARGLDGRSRYGTGLHGWYIKRDESLAVTRDGVFYVMSAPTSLRARVRGVTLTPAEPPLVVGAGGRDGESIPLEVLLQRRLAAGDEWAT